MAIKAQHSIAYHLSSGTLVIKAPPPLEERTRRAYRELWKFWRKARRVPVLGKWTYGYIDGLQVLVTAGGDDVTLSVRYGGGYRHWYGWRDCVRALAWLLASKDPLVYRGALALPPHIDFATESGHVNRYALGTPTQGTVLARGAL